MAETASSSHDDDIKLKFEVIVPIPKDIYIEYFNVMDSKKPMYIVVMFEKENDKNPTVFFEMIENQPVAGICRVFFRYKDVVDYILRVSKTLMIPAAHFKAWETNFVDLAIILHEVSESRVKNGEPGIRAVSTVKFQDRFRDVDIFWTREPNYMV